MTKRTGRCTCGVKLSYHFDQNNRFVACGDVIRLHPRTKVSRQSLSQTLRNGGARG